MILFGNFIKIKILTIIKKNNKKLKLKFKFKFIKIQITLAQ